MLLLRQRRQAHQEQYRPVYPAKGSLAVSLVRVSTPADTMHCNASRVQPRSARVCFCILRKYPLQRGLRLRIMRISRGAVPGEPRATR